MSRAPTVKTLYTIEAVVVDYDGGHHTDAEWRAHTRFQWRVDLGGTWFYCEDLAEAEKVIRQHCTSASNTGRFPRTSTRHQS